MGRFHADGYSAHIEGFFEFQGDRIRLAKTNGKTLVFVEPQVLPEGALGELVIEVDGRRRSRLIILPDGASKERQDTPYADAAPF